MPYFLSSICNDVRLTNSWFAGVLFLFLFLSGCSSSDRQTLSGTVLLDGKPLERGTISFRPVSSGQGNTAGGQILRGQFHFAAANGLKPGKYAAVVQVFRLTGRTVKDPERGDVPEMILVKYHEAGKLETDIVRGETNRVEFRLTTADVPPQSNGKASH